MRQWQINFRLWPPADERESLRQRFLQANLVTRINQALQRTGLAGACLKLEITESVIMDNASEATTMLEQLRALGAQISIDDLALATVRLAISTPFRSMSSKSTVRLSVA